MDEVATTEELPDAKFTEHRCSLPGDSYAATITPRRPIWFLGSEDNTLQVTLYHRSKYVQFTVTNLFFFQTYLFVIFGFTEIHEY